MPYDYGKIKRFKFSGIYTDNIRPTHRTLNSLILKSGERCLIIKLPININKLTPELELARRKEAVSDSKRLFKKYVADVDYALGIGELEKGTVLLICKSLPWLDDVKELRSLPILKILNSEKFLSALRQVNSRCLFHFLATGKMYDLFNSRYNTPESNIKSVIKRFVNPNIMIGNDSENNTEKMFIDSDWYIKFSDYKLTNFPAASYFSTIIVGLAHLLAGYILFTCSLFILKLNKSVEEI